MEPQDAPVHLRGAQRDPHHRPRPDGQAPRHGARVRHRDGRPRRERAVRRHQEAGAGARDAGGDAGRPALRHQALAGRHDDQLRHDQEAHRAARPARGPAARRRLRPPPQEGGRGADRGAEQAQRDARRHPQDEAPARRRLHRRPAPRAHRGDRGQQARDPGRSARATPTSTRTSSTTSSRPTTTRSARSGCSASWSPTRRSRAPASARRVPRPSPRPRSPRASRSPSSTRPPRRDLVAQLAAGGTLSFDPDLDDEDLLPGSPRPETPVPAGVAPREAHRPTRRPRTRPPTDPARRTANRRSARASTTNTDGARRVRTPYARDTGATRPWQSRPTPSRSSASEPARA